MSTQPRVRTSAPAKKSKWRGAISSIVVALLSFASAGRGRADGPHPGSDQESLKQLSLEQLGNLEVTTASKEPEALRKVPAAIYVITQEDIRRSGATSLPDVLRLAPGVEVAQVDSDHWSVAIRGFGAV
jgi:iron complex outermembrane recepter protein